jgi:ankyrin repeat protein
VEVGVFVKRPHDFRALLALSALLLTRAWVFAAGATAGLIEAAREGDVASVRTLVQRNVDVNAAGTDGTTALHWAAQRGDLEAVTLLIKHGANVNVANRYGATPLRGACENGNVGVVEALVKAGADVNAVRHESGDAPLMIAARSGHADVVRALLAHGANVNYVEPLRAQTALMWAAAEKHPAVVKVLLEAGANTKALSSTKISPLMFAIRAGDLESTRVLLATGLDIDEPAADGTHMLHFAIINARFDIAKDLVERGANLKVSDMHGTPLQLLTFMRKAENIALATVLPRQLPQSGVDAFELARVLLAHGDDVNARYTGGRPPQHVPLGSYRIQFTGATPFFIAATTADPAWMRFLAGNGADPNIPTAANITPLLGASGLGFWEGETPGTNADAFECVKLAAHLGNDPTYVVSGGAKPDPSWEGATALHGAATRSALDIVNWLIEQGVPLDTHTKRGISPYHIATDNAGGMYHIAPEIAERLLALAKERGEKIDTVPPTNVPKRN